jgi:hypothetical protein
LRAVALGGITVELSHLLIFSQLVDDSAKRRELQEASEMASIALPGREQAL